MYWIQVFLNYNKTQFFDPKLFDILDPKFNEIVVSQDVMNLLL